MKSNVRMIGAAKFKAGCLGLLDEVRAKRMTMTVTKNGEPVAQLIPMPMEEDDPIFGFYRGKLEIVGDIISPIHSDEELEEFFETTVRQLHGKE